MTNSSYPQRGNCPVCGFRVPLRKDGSVGKHWSYIGADGDTCRGTGQRSKHEATNQAARAAFKTAEEFEAWYAANSHVSIDFLHEHGRYGKPCDCGDETCTGWQMAHREDDEFDHA